MPDKQPGDECKRNPIPTPVILLDANRLGIRGLNQCLHEWTTKAFSTSGDKNTPEGPRYRVIGNASSIEDKNIRYAVVDRQPWESFQNVGFRCVTDP